jgi:hypothetical protein
VQNLSSGTDHKCYIITKLDNDATLVSTSASYSITTTKISTLYNILPIYTSDTTYSYPTSISTTFSGTTGSYAFTNGTYNFSASSRSNDGSQYVYGGATNGAWFCGYNDGTSKAYNMAGTNLSYTTVPYNGTTYAYIGGNDNTTTNYWTTVASSQTLSGEWFQVQFPFSLKMTDMSFTYLDIYRVPRTFYVVGSTDGTTWDLLVKRPNTNDTIIEYSRIIINIILL